ncbi:hypothetical protein MIR68_001648 [Amoeboaphelidium protococcarum]|nr:hypothetical protein MIR68_001648 [Amoeboaphelidium protococcarum]
MDTLDVTTAINDMKSSLPSTAVNRSMPYVVDLGHLLVHDDAPLPPFDGPVEKTKMLKEVTRDAVQVLINELWTRPTEISEDHTMVLAQLPPPIPRNQPFPMVLPRSKPVPKAKALTRWQKFAQAKGIQKEKRTRMVWSEDQQEFIPRAGYKSAVTEKSGTDDWLIEVPEGYNDVQEGDMFSKVRAEKAERVNKNKAQQLRNLQSSGSLSRADQKTVKKMKLEKDLKITTASTASMGRFDKPVEVKKIASKSAKQQQRKKLK